MRVILVILLTAGGVSAECPQACDYQCPSCGGDNGYCSATAVAPASCHSSYQTYDMDCGDCEDNSSDNYNNDSDDYEVYYYYFGGYYFYIWPDLVLIGLSILFQIIGTIVVCNMNTTNEPPCWAKCCFPICTVMRFDPGNCGACCGAWCLGWCFTLFCWQPPQQQRTIGREQGAPPVQVMVVSNNNNNNNNNANATYAPVLQPGGFVPAQQVSVAQATAVELPSTRYMPGQEKSSTDKLRELKALSDDGIISQAEFEKQKAAILTFGSLGKASATPISSVVVEMDSAAQQQQHVALM